jgi:hypothetical protein
MKKRPSNKPKPMGRPPLYGKVKPEKVLVSLAPGQRARIVAAVGVYGVSKFIREAIERELERPGRKAEQRRLVELGLKAKK